MKAIPEPFISWQSLTAKSWDMQGSGSIGDEGHITNVAVKPGFRNRKIGEGIIGVMIDFTSGEGIAHYTLEVRKSNVPAINLYEKFGFRTEGRAKKILSEQW